MIRAAWLLSVAVVLGAAGVQEPSTGITFPSTLQLDKGAVQCTGAAVRTKYLMKIYAVAHYGAADAPSVPAKPEERLAYWTKADALKAFVLDFVYEVSQKKIRGAWEEGLDNAGYKGPNREALVAAFTSDIKKGDEIRFIAEPGGTLIAEHNKKQLGSWKDPDLVKAIWAIWMGEKSPLGDKTALVGS